MSRDYEEGAILFLEVAKIARIDLVMKMTCPGSLIECESINISSSELMLMILYGTKTNSDIVQTTNRCKMLAQLGMFNAEKKQNI